MFTAIGNTALTVIVLQLVLSVAQGFVATPRAYQQMLSDNPKALRGFDEEMRKQHARHWTLVITLRGIFSRWWMTSDYIWAAVVDKQQASRIRAVALVQMAACTGLSGYFGFSLEEAFGLGSVTACAMFAMGALGAYSGRLATTAGDKRILGL